MTPREQVRERIRGLYAIADADASDGDPERMARALLAAGCLLLQLRCKGWTADDVERVAASLVPRCRAAGATFIVNDHVSAAVASGAHGVHLGQLDLSSSEARSWLGDGLILGRSSNDLDQAVEIARDADYVAFGPVFETVNAGRPKTVRDPVALAFVRSRIPRDKPLVAIGGITPDRLAAVRAAGADAWAVIGALGTAATCAELIPTLL